MPVANNINRPILACAALITLFCLTYLLSLGVRPLFIPDEVRYGEIAREMIAHSDWIVPRLDGLVYFEKPPFGHWLNAISILIFGENAFAIRIASAISVAVSASMLFFLGRHLFRAAAVPYLAVFIFLTTLEVQAVGTFSVIDSIFAAALNGGIATFFMSTTVSGRQRYSYLAISGGLFGIAFLTKGFLAFALPFLILVPWLVVQRQLALLFRQAWISMAFALLAIAPWGLAIQYQQADFWHYFFWVEHVQRFAAENAQHKEPFYYYVIFLPIAGFPWIWLLPASISGLRHRDQTEELRGSVTLLFLWAAVPLLFFSIANGKLITYILPCFLPFSLLVARGLLDSRVSVRLVRALIFAAGLLLLFFLLALFVTQLGQSGAPTYSFDEQIEFRVVGGALILAIVILIHGCTTRNDDRRRASAGLAMIPILIALPWVLPESVTQRKAPVPFLNRVYASVPDGAAVVTHGPLIHSVSWALKRDDIYIIGDGGETAYGLNSADGKARALSADDFGQLLHREPGTLLFCYRQCEAQFLREMPVGASTWSYGNFHAYFVRGSPAT